MEDLSVDHNYPVVFDNEYIKVYTVNERCLLVEAVNTYIPIADFQEAFNKAGDLVEAHGYTKLIFDKRKLEVFHQPSMVWYFVEWKEKMYEAGLTCHRKILPTDPVFRECVKLGREKLLHENPKAKYHAMDIKYKNSLEDAINS